MTDVTRLNICTYPDKSGQLLGHLNIQSYILGGKGVVTLKSPSGKHYTYSFRYPVEENTFAEGTMFCYCRMNNHHWLYVGMLTPKGQFWRTQFSHFNKSSSVFKGAAYIVKMMKQDFDTQMELYHDGVCAVCGRKLTTPNSVKRGIGPKCRRNLNLL